MPVNAIDVKNGSLQSVLDAALQGKGITYKIEDNIVYLSASGEPQTPQQTGQEHTVTGTVVDATGEALIGVNVQVKGNPTAGTITDFEGNYSLSVPGNGEIVFSYIGYRSETLKPDGKDVLNVTMQEDTQQIGEVVVTALGIKREKKMLGYAVQELKSDELNKTGDPSVTSALQGKVAGLQMNTSATGLGALRRSPFVVTLLLPITTSRYGLWMAFLSATTLHPTHLVMVVWTVVALPWTLIRMISRVFLF